MIGIAPKDKIAEPRGHYIVLKEKIVKEGDAYRGSFDCKACGGHYERAIPTDEIPMNIKKIIEEKGEFNFNHAYIFSRFVQG